ncbi:hypothetical protein EYB45_03095 [Erythrobacteraceae bacterium CFH 75059]|uniref:DUF6489 family protein n=1 Tax=Qipengyuania thermophila TaxID=2509361 RepID=UPI00101EF122|nr:DUF6489 family protein [Qipengyuania thermophila]TCD06694.1 hypothetical protein EYB45_03095 [Erythrobacteraceae bacterium CFH 75059]
MKLHVEIDCTPEEARRLMGLPDLAAANDLYAGMLAEAARNSKTPDQWRDLAQHFAPAGNLGLKMVQAFMENAARGSGSKPADASSPDAGDRAR